jgi:hypothetical protein
VKVGIKLFHPSLRLVFLGADPRRSKRLNPPRRPSISARITKRSRTILNNNTRKSQPIRNESPRGLVQCLLKIQLEIGIAINEFQECHNIGAAQLKRLKSAQMAIKKHLATS